MINKKFISLFFSISFFVLSVYNTSSGVLSDKVLSDLISTQQNEWPKVYKKSDVQKVTTHLVDGINKEPSSGIKHGPHYLVVSYIGGKFYGKMIRDYMFLPDDVWLVLTKIRNKLKIGRIYTYIEHNNVERREVYLNLLNSTVADKLDKNKAFSFIADISDSCPVKNFNSPEYPITHPSFPDSVKEGIVVPDPYIMNTRYAKTVNDVKSNSNNIPFEQRKEIGYWRGGLTGSNCTGICPREKLIWFSEKNPSYLDARLTYCSMGCKKFEEVFGNVSKYYTPMSEMPKYKYLISFDGYVAAWERVPIILHSGSVLLYNTKHRQWFNPYIKNNVHYIWIKDDCSDLKEKIDFLRKNPKIAKKIASNASALANEILTPEFISIFWTQIIRGIQDRFDNKA